MTGTRSALALLAALRPPPRAPGALVVDGAAALVPLLARELGRDGRPGLVREGGRLDGAAALVWVGAPDEQRLREASIARVPIVAVTDADDVPYVLATDLVRVVAGQGFPVTAIASALARRLGGNGPALAAALPVLRTAVVDELIAAAERRNGLLAAGLFVPAVDMPVLTLGQVRLVTAIAEAYGLAAGGERALEAAGVVGAGFGFRALARQALDAVPLAGWAVKGAVAAAGTRAVGEAARRYFEHAAAPTSAVRRRS
ncbi:MAG TPA: hypothetical protein VFA88_06250 [Gaiellaceae bacterium]|nr:hypothetical protein [Gaiellaceae bacterium]